MISQCRHGNNQVITELPGGVVDSGEDPVTAALRELQEETGYVGIGAVLIGSSNPNPAIFNNMAYTVLVPNAHQDRPQHLEATEDIEVQLVPQSAIGDLARTGQLPHALDQTAFYHYQLYQDSRS